MQRILIVEDDRPLGEGIALSLKNETTEVLCSVDLADAGRQLQLCVFELVILDINLPDGSGLELLRKIKANSSTSVILLTANDMEIDIVGGLERGADD